MGRDRGMGVEPEVVQGGEEVVSVSNIKRRGGRGLRTRGPQGRGAALQGIDRSQLYVGDIIPLVPESSTVHVGVPLEEPLQKKRQRRWDPNQPVSPLAESIETWNDTRTSPAATPSLPIPMQVPSPTDFVEIGRSIS